jgi:O-antigen ligase
MKSSVSSGLWVVLMIMMAIPIPVKGMPMPERGAPILYLIVAGVVLMLLKVSKTSVPLAVLLAYTFAHVMLSGYPLRGIQILLLMLMAGVLYIEAAALSAKWSTRVAWALVVGAALQGVLGIVNILHIFPSPTAPALLLRYIGIDPMVVFKNLDAAPWLTLASRDYLGRPMGWLTHPNYWGSYMALAVPVGYALMGRWVGLGIFAFVLVSTSIAPVLAAAVGLAVMAWRDLPRLQRPLLILAGLLIVVSVVATHVTPRLDGGKALTVETLTAGRTNVWAAAWPNLIEHPIIGNGVGSWRMWAVEYNKVHNVPAFATLQAHNEALQLLFEMGLLGVGAALWWAMSLLHGMKALWARASPLDLMWIGVLAVALVNSFGSPTFHLPAQAAVALFAAARLEAARRVYGTPSQA